MRRARDIWRASQGIHSHLLCDLDPVSPSLGLSYLLLNMAELDSGMASVGDPSVLRAGVPVTDQATTFPKPLEAFLNSACFRRPLLAVLTPFAISE